jgi:hypothetical protein
MAALDPPGAVTTKRGQHGHHRQFRETFSGGVALSTIRLLAVACAIETDPAFPAADRVASLT